MPSTIKRFGKYIARQFDILKSVAFVTYKEWSVYRTHSMVSIIVGPVFFIVTYFLWTAVYTGKTEINGLPLASVLKYMGASMLIKYLVMDFADWNLQMLVQSGKFLTFALRPIHHRFFALSQKVGHRVIGFVFEFLPCAIIFSVLFKIPMIPASPFWFVISLILSFLMTFYVNYAIGLTSFFLTQSNGIRNVILLLSDVFSGTLIPLVFFPEILQKLLFFLPFQYMTYVPAMIFTGSYRLASVSLPIPQIVAYQAIAVFIAFVLNECLYRVAFKRFTGVGA